MRSMSTHGKSRQNSCYVKWFQLLYKFGSHTKIIGMTTLKSQDLELVRGRSLRLGSAGYITVIRFISMERHY